MIRPRRPCSERIWLYFICWVVLFWVIALSAVCVRVCVQWRRHSSVYPTYTKAGRAWRNHGHLYTSPDDLPPAQRAEFLKQIAKAGEKMVRGNNIWGGFRYSPTAALLFVPISYMPGSAGEVLWRVLLAGASLGALWWCCRLGIPRALARRDWPIFFLLVLPAFTGCLNNGQSSLLVLAGLLGATAAACTNRWTLAAICIVIPTTFKLYPICYGLLLVLLFPRQFSWRLALALLVAFMLPFILRPGEMMEEHRRWIWHLINDAKTAVPIESWDQDIRLVIYRLFHIELHAKTFMALQLFVAAIVAGLALLAQRAVWPRRMLLARVLGLATCWMTTFGMATEPSTYVLVAPTLAWSLWELWLRKPREGIKLHAGRAPGGWLSRIVLVALYCGFLVAYVFLWFPWGKRANSYGLEPMAGLILFIYLCVRTVRELRRTTMLLPQSAREKPPLEKPPQSGGLTAALR
jgi:hypothetical protein